MRERARRFLFYLGILAGDCMVGVMFIVLSMQPPPAAATYYSPVAKYTAPIVVPAIVGEPHSLSVERLGLNWDIIRGVFDPNTNTWTDGGDQVVFAEGSLQPNDSNGTTLLYGHARSSVFAQLPGLLPGDEATIKSTNGYIFKYQFESMKEVLPTDVSVFSEHGAPKLVLQTCSGPWDSYRALYEFKFTGVARV